MSSAVQDVPAPHAVGVREVPDPEVPERATRRTYTAKYKVEVLAEYEAADRAGRGALLRREGLYTSLIAEWRKQRDRGALAALSATRGPKRAYVAGRCQPLCGRCLRTAGFVGWETAVALRPQPPGVDKVVLDSPPG
jgi:transposase-like protein